MQRFSPSALPFALIGVPIDSVGEPGGTEFSPEKLRSLASWQDVAPVDRGDISSRIHGQGRDDTGIIATDGVVAVTKELRQSVGDCLRDGYRPILLGGCCTQIIGVMAGIRDAVGRVGIAYLDGHLDLYDGNTSPSGEAADIPIASALGHGPKVVIEAAGGPSLLPGDIYLLGPRDIEEAAGHNSLMPESFTPEIPLWTNEDIRSEGPAAVAARVRADFEAAGRPFLLAVDMDILDQAAFPATDILMPNGLEWDEFAILFSELAQSPQLLGISVACYNPTKDVNFNDGRRLAELVVRSLEKGMA